MNKLKKFFSEPDNYINTKFMFIIFAILGALTVLFVKCLPVQAASSSTGSAYVINDQLPLDIANVFNTDIETLLSGAQSTLIPYNVSLDNYNVGIFIGEVNNSFQVTNCIVVLSPSIVDHDFLNNGYYTIRSDVNTYIDCFNGGSGWHFSLYGISNIRDISYSTLSFDKHVGLCIYAKDTINEQNGNPFYDYRVKTVPGLDELIDSGSFFIGSGVPYEIPNPDLPDTDTSPDSNTWLQKIYNNIIDFKNKVVDGIGNISGNIQNAIDSLNSIAYGVGNIFKYISEPFDNERYQDEFSNLPVYVDMNTITNLMTDSIFNVQELPSAVSSFGFEIDLSSIDIFGNPEPFYLDLNWYTEIKSFVNAFFIFIFSFSFIVFVLKKLPSVISGLGGK